MVNYFYYLRKGRIKQFHLKKKLKLFSQESKSKKY